MGATEELVAGIGDLHISMAANGRLAHRPPGLIHQTTLVEDGRSKINYPCLSQLFRQGQIN